MRDDVVLHRLIAERLEQHILRIAHGQGIGKLLQQFVRLIREVFVDGEVEASLVADIGQRAQACKLFVELVAVSQMDECLEVAECNCWAALASGCEFAAILLTTPAAIAIAAHSAVVRVFLR